MKRFIFVFSLLFLAGVVSGQVYYDTLHSEKVQVFKMLAIADNGDTLLVFDNGNNTIRFFSRADLGINRIVNLSDPLDSLDAVNLRSLFGSLYAYATITLVREIVSDSVSAIPPGADNQNLSSTKNGNRVAVNITGGDGTSFSVADADSSVTNEIQNLTKTKSGNNVTVNISSGTGTTFSVADGDSLTTNELNSSMTWTDATNTVSIVDAGGSKSVIITGFLESEVDGSVTNEIELPSQTGYSGKFLTTNGSSPSWATALTSEVDGSTTNEIQNLSKSKSGNNVTVNITSGTGTTFSVADSDSSITNEIQNVSYSASTRAVSISSGAGFTFPLFSTSGTDPGLVSGGTDISTKYLRGDNTWQTISGSDNWGGQFVILNSDSLLRGKGTTASPLKADTAKLATQYDLSGYVTGPSSSTNTGLALFDGMTGKLLKNSTITLTSNNYMYWPLNTAGLSCQMYNSNSGGDGFQILAGGSGSSNYSLLLGDYNLITRFKFMSDGNFHAYSLPYASTSYSLYYNASTKAISYSQAPSFTPGGSSGNIQYNNSSAFGGFGSWNGSTMAITGAITATGNILSSAGSVGCNGSNPLGLTTSGYAYFPNISAPGAPISGVGYLYIAGTSGSERIYFKNNGTSYDLCAGGGTGGWTDAGTTVNLTTSTDNVGIGTTGSSSYKLSVLGGTNQNGILSDVDYASGTSIQAYNRATTGNAYAGYFYSFGTQGGTAIYSYIPNGTLNSSAVSGNNGGTGSEVKYGGQFSASQGSNGVGVYGNGTGYDFYAAGSGTDYGSSSSVRWKKNICEIPDALKKLNSLRGVYFDWDAGHGGKRGVGFIAEEVGKVLPEIVDYESNGIDATGMDYSKMTPLLLQAIKELSDRVDNLQKEIITLKKQRRH